MVAKIDFSDAFNGLHRDLMLRSVVEEVPGIYRLRYLSYTARLLHYTIREQNITFSRGFTQRQPIGTSDVLYASIYCDLMN